MSRPDDSFPNDSPERGEPLSVEATRFDDWRATARRSVAAGIPPDRIRWIDRRGNLRTGQQDLFGSSSESDAPNRDASVKVEPAAQGRQDLQTRHDFRVPRAFLELARTVASHRSPRRWELLYRLLWRITGREKHLLEMASDQDVAEVQAMQKSVRRDAHKTKAFVRFRKTTDRDGELFVAWHRPDHYALDLTAPFFAKRFDVMRWLILTPDQSAAWDGCQLSFGPGMPRAEAPSQDELENLWKTYYANIFNPARIKLKAMQAEMPKKHWATMPETEIIDQMLRDAPQRVETMIRQTEGGATAKAYLPDQPRPTLQAICDAATACQGCDLHVAATQTVFGRGPETAKLVIIGEQPGDVEDRSGEPFVGPAGQLLREKMAEAGLDPTQVYITNAVKHFKFRLQGKRRLHVKPSSREIAACRPWLEAELETIAPSMIVCLGATSAGVVLGPNFRVTKQRGEIFNSDWADWTMATYHPSALLRVPDAAAKSDMTRMFVADLRKAAEHLRTISTSDRRRDGRRR